MIKKLIGLLLISFLSFNTNIYALTTSSCFDTDTELLIHANGSDGSTSFTDESSNAHTITAVGNAQVDTAQSKFGGASLLLDGNTDKLTTPDSSVYNLGSANFTWQAWVRGNGNLGVSAGANDGIIGHGKFDDASGSNTHSLFILNGAGSGDNIGFRIGGTVLLQGAHGMSNNVWYHVALIRGWNGNANDWAITIDGTAVATTTNATAVPDSTGLFYIGFEGWDGSDTTSIWNGWIDEVVITPSTAIWTANFTPPSSEYSACTARRRVLPVTVVS